MGKKKFEEVEYDPFEQEQRRSLARQITAVGPPGSTRQANPVPSVPAPAHPAPSVTRIVRTEEVPHDAQTDRLTTAKGHQKSRTFKCASSIQDKELDSFLLRLEEAAGTSVPFQVVARAAIAATMRSEEQIIDLIRRKPPMRRPANVSAAEYAQFEQYWGEVVVEALRKLRPYQ